MYTTSSAVSAWPLWNLTPCLILNVQTSDLPFGVQLVASTGFRVSVWVDRHRYSPVCASMSRPPWSATVTGLMAAVGVTMPALITAPGVPLAVEDELAPVVGRAAAAGGEDRAEQRHRDPDDGAAADEVAPGEPPGGELVDDVVSDLALVLAQPAEALVVDIPGQWVPPWDGADSLSWMVRSSVSGM